MNRNISMETTQNNANVSVQASTTQVAKATTIRMTDETKKHLNQIAGEISKELGEDVSQDKALNVLFKLYDDKQFKTENSLVQSDLESLEQYQDHLYILFRNMASKINVAEEKVREEVRGKIRMYETTINTQNESILKLNRENDSLKNEINVLGDKLDNLSEKLRQAEQIDATFNELRKTYHLQQITLEGVTAEKNNLQTATIELEKENSDLAAQIKILEENKIQLTEQLNTFADLQDKYLKLVQEKENNQKQISDYQTERAVFDIKLENQQKIIDELRQQIQDQQQIKMDLAVANAENVMLKKQAEFFMKVKDDSVNSDDLNGVA